MSCALERIKPLLDNFLVEGCYEPKGSFICSVDAPGFPSQDVTEEITEGWDEIWKQKNETFENKIAGTCWAEISKKMLYTWDDNHRLYAWTRILKVCKSTCYSVFATNVSVLIKSMSVQHRRINMKHICIRK